MTDAIDLVRQYLDAMVARDWKTVRATLAPNVVRRGPYNDNFENRDDYVAFLEQTFAWMQGYAMDVARVWGTDQRVCAELAETVTIDGRPLRTAEAIVFDVENAMITRVGVFLQASTGPSPDRTG